MCQKELNIGIRHFSDARLRLIAVRCMDAVTKEYIIFVRHIVAEDPQNGDTTNTRIEDTDRRARIHIIYFLLYRILSIIRILVHLVWFRNSQNFRLHIPDEYAIVHRYL